MFNNFKDFYLYAENQYVIGIFNDAYNCIQYITPTQDIKSANVWEAKIFNKQEAKEAYSELVKSNLWLSDIKVYTLSSRLVDVKGL